MYCSNIDTLKVEGAIGVIAMGENATVEESVVGKIIYTSWGYGQTNVDLAKITEVSASGKTVKARMVRGERAANGRTSENVTPTEEEYGDEFRLQVREHSGNYFRGSYPYIDGDMENTRRGTFHFYGDRDGLHQTRSGFGH